MILGRCCQLCSDVVPKEERAIGLVYVAYAPQGLVDAPADLVLPLLDHARVHVGQDGERTNGICLQGGFGFPHCDEILWGFCL